MISRSALPQRSDCDVNEEESCFSSNSDRSDGMVQICIQQIDLFLSNEVDDRLCGVYCIFFDFMKYEVARAGLS